MSSTSKNVFEISQAISPALEIKKKLGDLTSIEVFHNQILVATYVRSETTKGGIIRPQSNIQEDEYQGKVGIVMKIGPSAFLDDQDTDFLGQKVEVGDFLVYRVGDGFQITIKGIPCRLLTDRNIRMRVKNPEDIY